MVDRIYKVQYVIKVTYVDKNLEIKCKLIIFIKKQFFESRTKTKTTFMRFLYLTWAADIKKS